MPGYRQAWRLHIGQWERSRHPLRAGAYTLPPHEAAYKRAGWRGQVLRGTDTVPTKGALQHIAGARPQKEHSPEASWHDAQAKSLTQSALHSRCGLAPQTPTKRDRPTKQPHLAALRQRTRRVTLRPMRSLVQPPPAAPTAAPATAAETMTPCSQLSLQAGKALETLLRLHRKPRQGESIASRQVMRRRQLAVSQGAGQPLLARFQQQRSVQSCRGSVQLAPLRHCS